MFFMNALSVNGLMLYSFLLQQMRYGFEVISFSLKCVQLSSHEYMSTIKCSSTKRCD